MNKHPFDALTLENGAKLIFTPCPGTKGASLVDSVAQLKSAGASMLLTLMFDEEISRLEATSLPEICREHEITWLQLPIADDAAPNAAFETKWQQHQASIIAHIQAGGSIAVHCKGGSGRTGLVIGLILAAYGWAAKDVISAVQAIRPKALKHRVQLNYFNETYKLA